MKSFLKILVIALLAMNISCEKPAGPGGRASVKGRVYAHDFDNTQRIHIGEGYSSDTRVYISYGNNSTIDDDVRTAGDGTFIFRYLNKGHYKVFVNSLDTSLKYKGNDTYKAIIKEFDIKSNDEQVTLPDFVINK